MLQQKQHMIEIIDELNKFTSAATLLKKKLFMHTKDTLLINYTTSFLLHVYNKKNGMN